MKLNPTQNKACKSKKSEIIVYGGVGSGKTDLVYNWINKQIHATAKWDKGQPMGALCSNTWSNLHQSTLKRLTHNWDRDGNGWEINEDKSEIKIYPDYGDPKTILLRDFGTCSQGEHVTGLVDLGFVAIDGSDNISSTAYHMIKSRLRNPKGSLQILSTCVLPLDDQSNQWRKHGSSKYRDVFYMSVEENMENLPEDYIARIQDSMTIQSEFERMFLSKGPFRKEGADSSA